MVFLPVYKKDEFFNKEQFIMERKIVHIVGTGTIGEPLIGLLCDYRDQLGIDAVSYTHLTLPTICSV